jgi:puromycin-sensitive aminopeptidase
VKQASGEVKADKLLLTDKENSVSIGKEFEHVVLNAGGSGFYRVRYEAALAEKLSRKPQENLSVIERFNLINDAWASVRAGLTSSPEYLELVRAFSEEDDINVWLIISGSLQALHQLLSGESRTAFKRIVRELLGPQATKLGWDPKANESVQTKQLRGHLLDMLGTIGEDGAVVKRADEYFAKWKKDKKSIDSNLLPALVNILAYHGKEARYEEFKEASRQAKTPQEVIRFLYALAAFRDLPLLEKTMSSCLGDQVKTQDAPYVFASVAQNEIATEAAWKFLKKNWERMVETYPENGVVRMCSTVLPTLDRFELEKDAQEFFSKHKVESGDMAIAQGLELLRINVLLRERETDRLADYVRRNTSST